MPRIDIAALPCDTSTGYFPPHDRAVAGRAYRSVSAAGDLRQFGANFVTLQPGAWSSQRHWHSAEDELVVMLTGELLLVEDDCETVLGPGDIATFKAGVPNGHHLQNRSGMVASFLAIGRDSPAADACHYPDIDMFWSETTGFTTRP